MMGKNDKWKRYIYMLIIEMEMEENGKKKWKK